MKAKERVFNDMELKTFAGYPAASDRSTWDNLPEWQKKSLIADGEKYLNYSYETLPMTLWLELTRIGNRANYQDAVFKRREVLVDLVLAECAEHKGRFLDDIINGIFLTCEESGWQIPAHNSYIRDTVQLPFPIADRPILDLFSTQTGMTLSYIRYLLKDELDAVSPEICRRIEVEVKKRIIDPYFSTFFWFMGNGVEPTNNWTVWCTRNILLAAFMITEDPSVRIGVLRKAAVSVDCYIDEYPDDGCCTEGASYYHHSPLCLFECIDVMNKVSGDAFMPLFAEDKIKKMASYIMKVNVGGEYYLNYADCDPKCGLSGVREYLFAKMTAQEDMMTFASEQLNLNIEMNGNTLSAGKSAIHERLQEMFSYEECMEYAKGTTASASVEKTGFVKQASFPIAGVDLVDDGRIYLSVKSGDNTGSHKHNDTGSCIVYADGKPLLIDVGVENYTQKTFSEQRYELWTMQSQYHNLPTFGTHQQEGKLQHVPGLFAAENTQVMIEDLPEGKQKFTESMELKNTYEAGTPIDSYVRSYEFVSGGDVCVCDKVVFSGEEQEWFVTFMTYETPEVDVPAGTLKIGELGSVLFGEAVKAEVEDIPITDVRLARNWEHDVHRVRIWPKNSEFCWKITTEK